MDIAQFEECVRNALDNIPTELRDKIKNVAFIVEDTERVPRTGEIRIQKSALLLGLYQGVPLPERSAWYNAVLPDKITLFKKNIESISRPDHDSMCQTIRGVVFHEIAHYFGMDERQVRHWEQKSPKRHIYR